MNGTQEIVRHEYLAEYLGDRVTVEGCVQCYSEYFDPAVMRKVPSVLMRELDAINAGARWSLSNHIYVGYSDPLKTAGAEPGDVVRFDCLVHRFFKKSQTGDRVEVFGLKNPMDIEIVRKAPRRAESATVPAPETKPVPEQTAAVNASGEPAPHVNGRKPHRCRLCGAKPHGRGTCPKRPKEVTEVASDSAQMPPDTALAFDRKYECLLDVLNLVDKHGLDKVDRAVRAAQLLESVG